MNCTSFWNVCNGVRFVDMKFPQKVESGTWEDLQFLFDGKIAKRTKKVCSNRLTRVIQVIAVWIAAIQLQRLKNKTKPSEHKPSEPSEPFYFLTFWQTFFMKSPELQELSELDMWK